MDKTLLPRGPVDPSGRDGRTSRAAVQAALPFDDEADLPIDLVLTARARRAVRAADLPDLRVVRADPSRTTLVTSGRPAGAHRIPGVVEDVAAGDTRPARARALRRAGLGVVDIATRVGVDEALVQAWTLDVRAPRRRAGATSSERTGGRPSGGASPTAAVVRHAHTGPVIDATVRARAREDARARLASDGVFAAAVGSLAATLTLETHAASFTTARIEVAASVVRVLTAEAGLRDADVRVVVRIGSGLEADRVRHDWSRALGVAMERIATTAWVGAPAPDAADALVRVTDPAVVARAAGWCDALLPTEPLGHVDGWA